LPGSNLLATKTGRLTAFFRLYVAEGIPNGFALRVELKNMATADTLVCRCEDVIRSRLEPHGSWRAAKLHTRCGMGPCQSRVCGGATEFLSGWKPESGRPPIFPVPMEVLKSEGEGSPPAPHPI
jgi:D-hydroxyproline dehydrogenase subunit alpha